ncbi:hypothetical protein [Nitrosopumilus sp.]|uniref:hypothetical protein n=1 Tax=Nitrosopumilus sp. TaxID=2024843 RepID=UPI0034A02119
MNKAVIIGIVVAVIIGIVTISAVSSMQISNTESISDKIVEETTQEEEVIIEPILEDETEVSGRELSVELTESINLKSP